jgi:hypothetical protein
MRDKFRRLIGGRPSQPPAPSLPAAPPAAPSGPPSSLPDTQPGRAVKRPGGNPPAFPPVNPPPSIPAGAPPVVPPVSKPVHSVAEKLAGHGNTEPLAPVNLSGPDAGRPAARQQAEEYLERLQRKVNQLADDFAEGTINRDQFQKLYEHYQRERRGVEALLSQEPNDDTLRAAIGEGRSVVIRRQHIARAQGYAIYENESGMPITTLGNFELDPALVIPMLSSYRAAAKEIFGAGIRSTAIEGGHWLCFVPGELTTLLALFSTEPAQKQLEYIEDLHRLFEKANRHKLVRAPVDPSGLLFPHEFFLKNKT